MKNQAITTAALLLYSTLALAGIKEDLLDAEVKDVREFSSEHCDCKNPFFMGKTCIASTRFGIPDGAMFQDPLPLTLFEAGIVNAQFYLASTAYYQRCTYGSTQIIFKDPELQNLFDGKKYLFFEGVRGQEAWMRVSYIRPNGAEGYFDPIQGSFSDEKFYANQGEPMEHYQTYYPGKVVFQRPLYEVLSVDHVDEILSGIDHFKKMKAWLIMRGNSGSLVSFGEYVITVRFFKKPGSIPRNNRDLSAIGIQVIQQ